MDKRERGGAVASLDNGIQAASTIRVTEADVVAMLCDFHFRRQTDTAAAARVTRPEFEGESRSSSSRAVNSSNELVPELDSHREICYNFQRRRRPRVGRPVSFRTLDLFLAPISDSNP